MKYLFVDSVAGFGSTGKLVAAKCCELQSQGHDCLIAYGRKKNLAPDLKTIRIGHHFDVTMHGLATRIFDRHGFASKRATRAFIKEIENYNPDVVWIHSLHGYHINIEIFFDYLKRSNKKVIWTHHDCWNFTGHCAHFSSIGCERWKTQCEQCPKKQSYPASFFFDNSRDNYLRKKEAFTGLTDVTMISPSKWLADLIGQSFLAAYPVEVQYNRINHEIFKPCPSSFREDHGLQDQFVVLGVASVWSKEKGLDDFIDLSRLLDQRFKIVLVGLSPRQSQKTGPHILTIPRTNSQHELAEIYSSADVFVLPTYEENYPTVSLEAQACGTSVISYDTGGCRETLQQDMNNTVLEEKTAHAIYLELMRRIDLRGKQA